MTLLFGPLLDLSHLPALVLVLAFSAFAISTRWKGWLRFGRMLSNDFLMVESSSLGAEDQFAVACGAHLTVMNGADVNELATGLSADSHRERFLTYWGVWDRSTAIAAIQGLVNGGHRRYFDAIAQAVSQTPPEGLDARLMQIAVEQGWSVDLPLFNRNIVQGLGRLRERGLVTDQARFDIAAWDLGRAINLCRWAYDLQFITREEALSNIRSAARDLQSRYGSWAEMSIGYLLGRHMWNGDDELTMERCERIHAVMLANETSPWRRFSWTTSI